MDNARTQKLYQAFTGWLEFEVLNPLGDNFPAVNKIESGVGMKIVNAFLTFAILMVLAGGVGAQEAGASGYKIIQKVPLPGDGGFDFLMVDSDARRVYITHNDSVQVIDADSYKLVGTVENVPHPHGVVVLPDLGKGYASSGDPGSVVVFDLKTFKHLSEIPTYKDTDVILYDPATGKVLTFDGDSKNATVIDPTTDKVVKTIDLGASPEVAVSDGKGHIYDNLESKSEVLKIDAKTMKMGKSWPLAPGESPSGLSMDIANNRLFSGCHNKTLVVMNAKNGKVVQALPIGDHVDGTYFDPESGNIFVSCGDGTLNVIHEDSPDKYSVVENVQTEEGAKTLAFDPKTGHVFLTTAQREPAPTPTKEDPKPHRKIVPGTFHVLVLGK
jgi:YVTN family beta-propeller protein